MISTVISILRNVAPIATLVDDRIYAGRAPQNATMPNIVIAKTSEREEYELGGAAGIADARFVVICRGDRLALAYDLGQAVISALRYCRIGDALIQRDTVDSTDIVNDGRDIHFRTVGFTMFYAPP